MIHKYYKLGHVPEDKFNLPEGAEYKDYGEKRYISSIGWNAVGEVYIDRKLKPKEALHYELWEAL